MRHRDRDVWLAQRIKCTLNHISMYGEWIQTGLEVSRCKIDSIQMTHGVQINGVRCDIYTVIEAQYHPLTWCRMHGESMQSIDKMMLELRDLL